MNQDIENFIGWIAKNYNYKNDPITHLKLQKLCFYLYGALMAKDLEFAISPEPIQFEAWDHGPVNTYVYNQFRKYQGVPIDSFPAAGVYAGEVEETLRDALTVYGAFDGWALRQQSHLEQPWKDAYQNGKITISSDLMKTYFKIKFSPGNVDAPEYFFGLGSFLIDGIPVQRYHSLKALAEAVKRVQGIEENRSV